ncbi:MAG: hypothetical protein K8S21_06440 [Gemmatimonadetes bacterium]|nr:hypothetical protein [Gemmatimonadota bacterium]
MSRDDRRLEAAVALGIITADQARAIAAIAPARDEVAARSPRALDAASIAYVVGAITVVLAMGWFLADRWKWLGAGGVVAVCALYAAVLLFTAQRLRRDGYSVAGGFAVLLAVATVPPAVLAGNELLHWFTPRAAYSCGYPDFIFWSCRGEELVVELLTAVAALFALRKVRFSLLVLPLALIAARLIFHLADAGGMFGRGDAVSGWIWAMGGSVLVAAAHSTDRRQRGDEDFAFWLHVAAAFCAIPATLQLLSATEWYRHLLVPGAFVAFAMALTMRRFVWLLLGMGWFVGYLGWLASDVFRDSPAFPILLAALGIAVIIATVWVQRNAAMLVGRFGTVTSDGRPRFPGGVPLLLAPALVALLLFPSALREDLERRRVHDWQARRQMRATRLQRTKAEADSVAGPAAGPAQTPVPGAQPKETPPPPQA